MTGEIALALLAAAVPVTALIVKLIGMVTPVQFVRLETQFQNFQDEVRKDLNHIRKALDKDEK